MSYTPRPHLQCIKPAAATPYIPPHLRQRRSHDDPGKPASSSPQHPPADYVYQHPHLNFRSVSDVIYRFLILLHHEHMSCQHVKFTPFEGDTYTHLKHFQLYTLTPDPDHPPQQQNSTEVIEQIHMNPAKVISESWKEDFKEVLEKFGRFTQGSSRDKMLPVILLRFGRNLFHDCRGLFDWGSSHTPENLERNVKTKRLSKTFDVGLSRQQFVFLRELARKDALHIQSELKFTIQVADEMRPGPDLSCICYLLSEHNEQSVNPGKMDDQPEITGSVLELQKSVNPGKMDDQPEITGSVLELKKSVDSGNMDHQAEFTGSVLELKKMDDQPEITGSAKYVLELKKVMLNPVRHMIGDISCGGKSCDIRLAFQIEEYPLTEMELCDLKSIFNKASFDDTSFELPPYSTFELPPYSTSGRFKFVGCAVERMRVVTGGELKWSFHSRTYQAYVEPIICQELCEVSLQRFGLKVTFSSNLKMRYDFGQRSVMRILDSNKPLGYSLKHLLVLLPYAFLKCLKVICKDFFPRYLGLGFHFCAFCLIRDFFKNEI